MVARNGPDEALDRLESWGVTRACFGQVRQLHEQDPDCLYDAIVRIGSERGDSERGPAFEQWLRDPESTKPPRRKGPKPNRKAAPARKRSIRFEILNAFIDVHMVALKPLARTVWLTMWRFARGEDNTVRKSHGEIAILLGANRRSVIRSVGELLNAGHLVELAKGDQATQTPSRYRMHGEPCDPVLRTPRRLT